MKLRVLLLAVLSLSASARPAVAAECDTWWKEMRASLLAFRELHFSGSIPGVSTQMMEMKVVETPVDKGPEAFDVKTKTDIRGLPIQIPGLGDHATTFTHTKFCAEFDKKDPELTIDGQSPGAATARIFNGKPGKIEKVTTPAGKFDAEYYTFAVKTKKNGKPGHMKMWVAKLHGHRIPVRTIVQVAELPATFDVQLTKAVRR